MNNLNESTWLKRAREWASDQGLSMEDRQKISDLLLNRTVENEKILEEMFYQELDFGTAGLRGIVGLGSNRMNIYNIQKASHALALTIKNHIDNNNSSTPRVVISYDSRLSSREFALTSAQVLCTHNIQTFLMPRAMATPILSFAVRDLHCTAGIMVTASHNPKDYNGFKVYWSDGAQITSPIDRQMMSTYNSITSFATIPSKDTSKEFLLSSVPEELFKKYYDALASSCLRPQLCEKLGSSLKVVYTPLHGTGAEPVKNIFARLGFSNLHLVTEQELPDGNFPTTYYPNPEDPKALTMAKELMEKLGADVAIGSDPDTDRMGVILKSDGEFVFLSGNDIATLLLYYKLTTLKEMNKLTKNSLVLKSIVTTPLHEELCKDHNVQLINTLTGFKWMAEVLREREEKSIATDFVFASEESFGSMPNAFVRDKDGVAAAILLCEALLYFKTQNKTFFKIKDELNATYGYFYDEVLNFQFQGITGLQKMKLLMKTLKQVDLSQRIKVPLEYLEDYENKISTHLRSGEKSELLLPKTSMLGLIFQNKSIIYVRPSGTEPKIKFYLLLKGENRNEVQEFATVIKHWIEETIQGINASL